MISYDGSPICGNCLAPLATREWVRGASVIGVDSTEIQCDQCIIESALDSDDWVSLPTVGG